MLHEPECAPFDSSGGVPKRQPGIDLARGRACARARQLGAETASGGGEAGRGSKQNVQ
jgi:hypothetical protein